MRVIKLFYLLVICSAPFWCHAQIEVSFSDSEIEAQSAPVTHVTTGESGGTRDINSFLGATRYTEHAIPINGQNTITTNLEAGHFFFEKPASNQFHQLHSDRR